MTSLEEDCIESAAWVRETRLKMTVTLRDATASIAVFLWSAELTFVDLNLTEFQSLWTSCDTWVGRQARLGFGCCWCRFVNLAWLALEALLGRLSMELSPETAKP